TEQADMGPVRIAHVAATLPEGVAPFDAQLARLLEIDAFLAGGSRIRNAMAADAISRPLAVVEHVGAQISEAIRLGRLARLGAGGADAAGPGLDARVGMAAGLVLGGGAPDDPAAAERRAAGIFDVAAPGAGGPPHQLGREPGQQLLAAALAQAIVE